MQDIELNTYLRSDLKYALKNAAIGIYVLLFLIILALLSGKAQAKTIYYGKKPQTVRLTASEPTLFKFPLEVKNVLRADKFSVKPASEEDPNYAMLSIEPRFTQGESEVLFLLADGQTVPLKLTVVPKTAAASSSYTFESQEDAEPEKEDESDSNSSVEVNLLKSMIRGEQVNGYRISSMSRDIPSKGNGEIKLVGLYQGQSLTGFIFKVKNTSYRKNLYIDVRDLTIGSKGMSVLSQIDDSDIAPKGKEDSETFLRVVAKTGSSSSNLIVPMKDVAPPTGSSK